VRSAASVASAAAGPANVGGNGGTAGGTPPTTQNGWFPAFKREYKQQRYTRGLPSNKLRRKIDELQETSDGLSFTNSRLHTRVNDQKTELERLRTESPKQRTALARITQTEEEFQWRLKGILSNLMEKISDNQADCDIVEYLREVHDHQHARAEEVMTYLTRAAPDLAQALQEKRAELDSQPVSQEERNVSPNTSPPIPILEGHRSLAHSSSGSPEPGPSRKRSRTDSDTESLRDIPAGLDYDFWDEKGDIDEACTDPGPGCSRSSAAPSEEHGNRGRTV